MLGRRGRSGPFTRKAETRFPLPATLEGERASTEASNLLDRVKAAPSLMEVAVMRLYGGEWKFVERSLRNDRGEWAVIPFSQDYPIPTDDEDE